MVSSYRKRQTQARHNLATKRTEGLRTLAGIVRNALQISSLKTKGAPMLLGAPPVLGSWPVTR
jgi:hypothetical protein